MTQVVTDMVSGGARRGTRSGERRGPDMVADVVTADGACWTGRSPAREGSPPCRSSTPPGSYRCPSGAGHLDRRPGAAAAEGHPAGPDLAGARPRPRARAGTRRRVGVPGPARAARRDRDGPGVAAAARRVGPLPAPGARRVPLAPLGVVLGAGARTAVLIALAVSPWCGTHRPGRPRRAGRRLHRRQRACRSSPAYAGSAPARRPRRHVRATSGRPWRPAGRPTPTRWSRRASPARPRSPLGRPADLRRSSRPPRRRPTDHERRRPGGAARRDALAHRGASAPLGPVRRGHRALPRHRPARRRAPADAGRCRPPASTCCTSASPSSDGPRRLLKDLVERTARARRALVLSLPLLGRAVPWPSGSRPPARRSSARSASGATASRSRC